MTASDTSPGDLGEDHAADRGERTPQAFLEIAQQIARETLAADHQALELYPPSLPLSLLMRSLHDGD